MADKTLRFDILARDQNTRRTLEGIADAAEDAADEIGDIGKAARKADNDIEGLEREILKLKTAMAGVDGDLFKDMDRQLRGLEGTLRRKLNVRKAFGDIGSDGAMEMSASFSQRIGPLLLKAPVSAPLMGAMAGAAPVISSAIAGAVTAGVALASVGAGIKIAFSDPAVKQAGEDLGADLASIFKGAAAPFVPETIKAIGIIRSEFQSLRPTFESIFTKSATYVEPLAHAVAEAAGEMAEGFDEVVANAGPVVEVLGEHIPKVAATASDAMAMFARGSKDSAAALDSLLTATEMAIGGTSLMISTLNKIAPFVSGPIMALGDLSEKTTETGQTVQGFTGYLGGYTSVASKSAFATMTLAEQVRSLAEANSSAFGSETRLGEAIAESTSKIYRNKDAINASTEKGRANREMLQRLASATLASRDALVAQTRSADAGNVAMQRGYNAFVKAAVGMGMSKKSADALARSLGLIPPAKNVNVTVPTGAATAAVRVLQAKIAELKDKNVYITGTVRWVSTGLKVPGGTILRRWGGITEHAQTGLLREAQTFAPAAPARYAFAEPATGGEAFIPRRGDRGRSMQILDKAASWYGASVVPGGGGGGAPVLAVAPTGFNGLEKVFLSWLLEAVRGQWGTQAAQNLQGLS